MGKILNSIGRKILLIISISLITISILVLISLNFFGKISHISRIEGAAYKYEIMAKEVVILFNEYRMNNNEKDYNKALKLFRQLTTIDGRMGELYRLLKEGNSVEKSTEIYIKKTGKKTNILNLWFFI